MDNEKAEKFLTTPPEVILATCEGEQVRWAQRVPWDFKNKEKQDEQTVNIMLDQSIKAEQRVEALEEIILMMAGDFECGEDIQPETREYIEERWEHLTASTRSRIRKYFDNLDTKSNIDWQWNQTPS